MSKIKCVISDGNTRHESVFDLEGCKGFSWFAFVDITVRYHYRDAKIWREDEYDFAIVIDDPCSIGRVYTHFSPKFYQGEKEISIEELHKLTEYDGYI
jgi:hypothetical protein